MSSKDVLKEIAQRNLRLLDLCVKGLTSARISLKTYGDIKVLAREIQKLAETLP